MNAINKFEIQPSVSFGYGPKLRHKPPACKYTKGMNGSRYSKQVKLPNGIKKEEFIEKYKHARRIEILSTAALYGTGTIAAVSFLYGMSLLGVINAALCASMLLDKKFMKEYRENKDNVSLFRDLYNKLVQDSNVK